ncbi:alpha/beta-Hydrolases superfamily protein [Salvia divinorum]|uniref:Alpha/beta-Hydrolases superfamily protein n=1 Tax=Salvia divinorum TaxID=28513 RepID=A0ABD1HTW8_SALDI
MVGRCKPKKPLLICGECDNIVDYKLAEKLLNKLPNATMRQVPGCGHMPHIEKPYFIAKLIADFAQGSLTGERLLSPIIDSVIIDTVACNS